MITLVGVGHVFDLRAPIREVIVGRSPSVVGIELDRVRYEALRTRDLRGDAPVLYRLMSLFQERIATKYGGEVGEEMLAAADAAREVGADVALIDQDSAEVFHRLWGGLSFEERVRLFVATVVGLFVTRRRVEKELRRFESDSEAYLAEFGNQFPQVKRVLVDDRDAHMARTLQDLHAKRGRIVAVVGDGHVEGIRRYLGGAPVEIIRLRELREGRIPPAPEAPSGAGVTFSYEIRDPP